MRRAVRKLRDVAHSRAIDDTRFAVAGSSAGGHLAAMLGVAADEPSLDAEGLGLLEDESPAVQVVFDFFGPTDLLAMDADAAAVVVSGSAAGRAVFYGPDGREQDRLDAIRGGQDVFLARYDRAGGLLWLEQAGGRFDDVSLDVAVLPGGDVAVAGAFGGQATFGEGDAEVTLVGHGDRMDVFLARYRADGGLVWARRAGGPGDDEGRSVEALADGTILLAGTFQDTTTFAPGEANATPLTSEGADAGFVALYDGDGGLVWVTAAQSSTQALVHDVAGRSDRTARTAIATGSFSADATLGEGDREVVLAAPQRADTFLMRLLDYGPAR